MTTATATPDAPAKAPAARKSTKLQGLQVFMENRLAVFGVLLLLILLAFSFIGPMFYVTDQIHTDLSISQMEPSAEHPLGTDMVGYDQLGRLMKGGQTSIIVGLFAGIIATTIGTLYGAIAGFVGGWIDAIMMRIVDALMSVPVLFLFMLIATMIPPTVPVLIIIMSALSWLGTSRLIRGEALSLRTREYVVAMRGMGGSMPRAIRTHIVRNTIGTVIVNATFQVADAVLYVAYLSFLGLGAQPPATDWGAMLSNSQSRVYSGNWWLLYPPGVLIILLVLSFNFIGDGLRDAFEVRLRKR